MFYLVALVFVSVSNVSAKNLPIEQVIYQALMTNPNIKADHAAAGAQRHTIDQEKSAYLPSINLSADAGYDKGVSKTRINPNPYINLERRQGNLNVSQLLYDGSSTHNKVDMKRAEFYQKKSRRDVTIQEIAYYTAQAYINLRRYELLIECHKKYIKILQDILGKVDSLVKGELSSDDDLAQAKAELSTTSYSLIEEEKNFADSQIQLLQLTGDNITITKEIVLYNDLIPNNRESFESFVLKRNANIKESEASLQIQEKQRNLNQSNYLPTVSLEVDKYKSRNVNGLSGYKRNLSAVVAVKYNIYNGGKVKAKDLENIEKIVEHKHRLEQMTRLVLSNARTYWNTYFKGKEQIPHIQEEIKNREEVFKIYLDKFDLTQKTLFDLLVAAKNHFIAQQNLINIQSSVDLAYFQLLTGLNAHQEYLERRKIITADLFKSCIECLEEAS